MISYTLTKQGNIIKETGNIYMGIFNATTIEKNAPDSVIKLALKETIIIFKKEIIESNKEI